MAKLRYIFLFLSALSATILFAFPKLDISFSTIFFDTERGFIYKFHPILFWIFKFIPILSLFWGLGLGIYIIYSVFRTKNPNKIVKLPAIFLILSMLIGPGITVNYVLKENWGRARPCDIQEFGGASEFARAGVVSNQCVSNCSFTSGHAAMGYYFTSLSWISPIHLQSMVFVATFLFGTIVGFGRIAQGSHFLSDVIFSLLIVLLVNELCFRFWIYLKRKYSDDS